MMNEFETSMDSIELVAIKEFMKKMNADKEMSDSIKKKKKKELLLTGLTRLKESETTLSANDSRLNELLDLIPGDTKLNDLIKVLESVDKKHLSAKYVLLRKGIIKYQSPTREEEKRLF